MFVFYTHRTCIGQLTILYYPIVWPHFIARTLFTVKAYVLCKRLQRNAYHNHTQIRAQFAYCINKLRVWNFSAFSTKICVAFSIGKQAIRQLHGQTNTQSQSQLQHISRNHISSTSFNRIIIRNIKLNVMKISTSMFGNKNNAISGWGGTGKRLAVYYYAKSSQKHTQNPYYFIL